MLPHRNGPIMTLKAKDSNAKKFIKKRIIKEQNERMGSARTCLSSSHGIKDLRWITQKSLFHSLRALRLSRAIHSASSSTIVPSYCSLLAPLQSPVSIDLHRSVARQKFTPASDASSPGRPAGGRTFFHCPACTSPHATCQTAWQLAVDRRRRTRRPMEFAAGSQWPDLYRILRRFLDDRIRCLPMASSLAHCGTFGYVICSYHFQVREVFFSSFLVKEGPGSIRKQTWCRIYVRPAHQLTHLLVSKQGIFLANRE
jgi:hypothetical protein